MSRYVNCATVHFQIPERQTPSCLQKAVLKQFETACEVLDGTGVDLVITCEGMVSGQTVGTAEAIAQPGPMLNAYAQFARSNHCHVIGAAKLLDGGKVYNAQVVFGPDGRVAGDYRKTYLTKGEIDMGLTPGNGASIVETGMGRIGGIICFDLNFEELRQSYRRLKPDILAFSSMFHGGHMQKTWAYECRSFFAAACKDNTSDILDPLGRNLATANFHTHVAWARINLDRFFMHCDRNALKFPDIRRKYGNDVRIDRTNDLGVAILYSEHSGRTAAEIANEFELLSMDDYLENAVAANKNARGANS